MNDAARRVAKARMARGWSIRTAAQRGEISNQTWSVFERTGTITPAVHRAVMKALDWPSDWPESDVEPATSEPLGAQVAELERQIERSATKDELSRLRGEVERQGQRIQDLSRLVADLLGARLASGADRPGDSTAG